MVTSAAQKLRKTTKNDAKMPKPTQRQNFVPKFWLPSFSRYIVCITSLTSLPKLKTEEGYSAAIVRTYIPGDICSHNVRTMSAQHLTKDICLMREMLCGHSADIVWTYIFRDICHVRTMSFFGFQSCIPFPVWDPLVEEWITDRRLFPAVKALGKT